MNVFLDLRAHIDTRYRLRDGRWWRQLALGVYVLHNPSMLSTHASYHHVLGCFMSIDRCLSLQ